jgi:hypothetical protein
MARWSIATIASCLVVISVEATARGDSMQIALELGNVLASESECGLSYNQQAIEAFIEKKVDAGDMGFTSTLQMMTSGSKVQIESMTPSQKAAHCAQIRRVAKKYRFVN